MIKLKKAVSGDKALLAVMFGKTRVGKSGVCGTLGKNTLYLHTPQEAHGAEIAAKVAAEQHPDVSVFPVNIGEADENDVGLGIIKDKSEVGRRLSDDETWVKLQLYVNEDIKGVEAIVIDSITDLCGIIERTKEFEKICSRGGAYNKWKERTAFEEMFYKLLDLLSDKRDKGIDCICNIAAVYTYDEAGNITGLKPELPMFGVVDAVLKAFPDVFPLDRIKVDTGDGGQKEVIAFVMNMRVGKVQYATDAKTKKTYKKDEMFSNGRITSYEKSIPLSLDVDLLKADFSKLKESFQLLREEQGL